MTEQITDARNNSEHATARGPFRLDEFNLYRFWFSVRNVFFPMHTELANWKIRLVDTSSSQICCDRPSRCIEITDRIFADRNDLRTTLVLATIVTQSGHDSPRQVADDTARIAEMAAFIRHFELASSIRSMHEAMQNNQIKIAFNQESGLVHCRIGDSVTDASRQTSADQDSLFDDTLASGSFARLLAEEIAKSQTRSGNRKTVA